MSEALSALREEQLPALVVRIPRRGRVVYPWVAAAAAVVLMLALPYLRHGEVVPAVRNAEPAAAQGAPEVRPAKAEPLKIKIMTPDPNVVIYWLVQPKEGE
jgi:hypothetical protein